MEMPGIPTTRWFDATLMPGEQEKTAADGEAYVAQPHSLKAMMVFGHGGNTVTRIPESVKGLEKLELLVVADPHPTTFAQVSSRRDGTYLLPICTNFEMDGSRTASNRSLQWGFKIVEPIFESRNDYDVMYMLAQRLGFADRMFSNIEVQEGRVSAEGILREMNRGLWSIGYTGQSPERLKQHMEHQDKFDLVTLRGREGTPVAGEVYGLPWPCWGTPEIRHPGSHILYNTNLHVKEGGGTFRARFGIERNGETLLAEGSWSKGSEIEDGYPEFTVAMRRPACSTTSAMASTARPGPPTFPAASSGWRWNMAARPTAMPRPAPSPGTCRTLCRSTASRSTRPAPISSPNTRPCRTAAASACRISARACRPAAWRWRGTSPSC
jgi:formate dehydrogenase major subunit